MHDAPIPYGYCHCGCGRETRRAKHNNARNGWVAGEPLRYVHGHHARKTGARWDEKDCGHRTPCWIWNRSCFRDGYGQVRVGYENWLAHRAVYTELAGAIPEGYDLHHECEVKACVNPEHLVLVHDPEHRQRHSRLTWANVKHIRETYAKKAMSQTELAEMYGISQQYVSNIVRGKTWKV